VNFPLDSMHLIVHDVTTLTMFSSLSQDNTQVDVLQEFRSQVRKTDVRINSQFHDLIRTAQKLLHVPDREFADALFASRPTINRWINGRNLPHLSARKHAASWIARRTTEEITRLKRQASSSGNYPTSHSRDKVAAG